MEETKTLLREKKTNTKGEQSFPTSSKALVQPFHNQCWYHFKSYQAARMSYITTDVGKNEGISSSLIQKNCMVDHSHKHQ